MEISPAEKSMRAAWRERLYEIIFESDTFAGQAFDIALLWAILFSVITVVLESVGSIESEYGHLLKSIEWWFSILFTFEYALRIISARKASRYIFSFLGIIDFLAIIPSYLGLFFFGIQYMVVIRTLRLLRVFRILKLARYTGEAKVLTKALTASRYKITVFLVAVLTIVIITGTFMYLIEGADNGFTSIPRSIYWAIVTLTTVGYGDIAPKTILGQTVSSILMIVGYGIIAVPTGIVTVEMAKAKESLAQRKCAQCGKPGHDDDAGYCKFCGKSLK